MPETPDRGEPRFVVVDKELRIFFADTLAGACDRRIVQGSGTIYAPLAYETVMRLAKEDDRPDPAPTSAPHDLAGLAAECERRRVRG